MKQTLLNKVNFTLFFLSKYYFGGLRSLINKIHINDSRKTLKYIIDNKVSVSRFGDGELGVVTGHDSDFQKCSDEIISKLKEVLNSNMSNHIVCLPYPWKILSKLKYRAFEYWGAYLISNLNSEISRVTNLNKTYYDSSFTRFYIDYRNDKIAKTVVPLLKQIWQDRNICIVEGEFSRLGVGNDLFNNSKSISRIIAPSHNAFSVYDDLIKAIIKIPKDNLVLIALGMTATCLAYDLSKLGYQAIDIGHVDIEYEWFNMKAKNKVAIKNKYVAESGKQMEIDRDSDLSNYHSQIINKVGLCNH